MVLRSLKSCIQFAKAIVSANLRTLEAISILAETDALNFAPYPYRQVSSEHLVLQVHFRTRPSYLPFSMRSLQH